jgi:1,2-diacylglycerol 3-beta-glucosyltransferase
MHLITILYACALAIPAAVVIGSVVYMLLTLTAAARNKSIVAAPAGGDTNSVRFAIVVPAHDEEPILAATLRSLEAQDYPADRYQIVVVADNCTDGTAEIARAEGVTVLERTNRNMRGKGYALDWAMEHLLTRAHSFDAFVIIDADTWVASDFLAQAARGLAQRTDSEGRCALQGRYGVLNDDASWRSALMAAAFELFNHVKPLGRDGLGLSVSLRGNGMIFSRALMEKARWRGDSVTEDIDFGLDLVQHHGVRVGYLPAARVRAQMPITAEQARSQRERWEGGRYRLIRERAFPLLLAGFRRRSLTLCDTALDLLLLPLAELGAVWLLWSGLIAAGIGLRILPEPFFWAMLATFSGVGLLLYVLAGLRLAGAPRTAYAALLRAPLYAFWKMWLYLGKLRFNGGGTVGSEAEWVRTARVPVPLDARPANGVMTDAHSHTKDTPESPPRIPVPTGVKTGSQSGKGAE